MNLFTFSTATRLGRLACCAAWLLGTAGIALAAESPGSTTLYKSVGPDGKTIYSDHPPAQARTSKPLVFRNAPASALPPEAVAEVDRMRKSAGTPAAPPAGETVLFSASWCGYCQKAKSYLNARNLPYREVDVDTPQGKQAFVNAGGGGGVPLLVAKGRSVAGFSTGAYDAVFGAAR